MRRIAVFCGSSIGTDTRYESDAALLGETLARNHIGLVYGGATIGLMGAVADAVLRQNGHVTGVIPRFLQSKEVAHKGLSELIVVDTMHERKASIQEKSDGFIALPGGFGTLEELFEVLTWSQLGLHQKPVGLLNTGGFYNHLVDMLSTMVTQGFVKEANRQMLLVSDDIPGLLDQVSKSMSNKSLG